MTRDTVSPLQMTRDTVSPLQPPQPSPTDPAAHVPVGLVTSERSTVTTSEKDTSLKCCAPHGLNMGRSRKNSTSLVMRTDDCTDKPYLPPEKWCRWPPTDDCTDKPFPPPEKWCRWHSCVLRPLMEPRRRNVILTESLRQLLRLQKLR
jgi:hypothetical protein